MQNVYEYCPQFANEKFLLRLISAEDTADLLKVYSNPLAVPFFTAIIVTEMTSVTRL